MRDVLIYTFTAFGGPQAHLSVLLREFVHKRKYITEEELMELNALTQMLPGPSSTQVVVGIGYKVGKVPLAVMTFLVWIFPSAAIMCAAGIGYKSLSAGAHFTDIIRFIQPIAVGIVAYATYSFANRFLTSKLSIMLAVGSAIVTLILRTPYAFPLLILLGGIMSSALETRPQEDELRQKLFSNVNPNKISYFIGVLLFFAVLGTIINRTSPFSLPVRLFENFYRNGIMTFGGAQVLVPLMYTEFVALKHYLANTEFLAGYAIQQALPGPTFAFTSFVGSVTMANQGYTIAGQILGALVAVIGINMPGLILILFIVPFWEDLKKITRIRNSLSGINAVAVGFMFTAIFLLAKPMGLNWVSYLIVVLTFVLLKFTPVKTPLIIIAGVLIGWFL
ncbi:chromate efflux transporter [Mucilaginibacter ginkgonis]|uniref:Chromate efflux transporter n=1 Tax=Mucilaginibacter ginkgonis TaxID=2682091 RepID=A0A6I4HXD7_9SPHI|nr:chromate efflux transporter [Mucilaginibacter ginkgonis]